MADARFDVHVEVAADRVEVVARDWTSRSQSSATILRTEGAEVSPLVPIGTRDARFLSMLLDGEPVALTPGPGRITRGSYKVTATWGAITYRLSPASEASSRFTRDGARLGNFSRISDTEIRVSWENGAPVAVADAAVGYVLAAAFGTGKRFFLAAFLSDAPDANMPI